MSNSKPAIKWLSNRLLTLSLRLATNNNNDWRENQARPMFEPRLQNWTDRDITITVPAANIVDRPDGEQYVEPGLLFLNGLFVRSGTDEHPSRFDIKALISPKRTRAALSFNLIDREGSPIDWHTPILQSKKPPYHAAELEEEFELSDIDALTEETDHDVL
jgi:hypothetical protein